MSVAKVIELLSEGDSIENAVQNGVDQASKTIDDIRHVYADDFQAIVEGGRIVRYRVNCKVTFIVK